ncbi:MAG: DUF808 domain-containing protein [Hyphomicrobium sp.]
MSTGLLALLDDVVALAKLAAATLDDASAQAARVGAKTAGVLVDDAAVTPRYVTGLAAERELPIVGRIALGSLKNKLIYLMPVALLLSVVAPWALTPILMAGGLYLCFEGYEKIHSMLAPHASVAAHGVVEIPAANAKALEDRKVAGAIRTDLVLSAEIMAISLANITAPSLIIQALVLALVGILVTVGVYGAVALIVKADDLGVWLALNGGPITSRFGRWLVRAMPPFLKGLAFVGTIAMLWVGGGILIHGFNTFGFSAGEHLLHAISETLGGSVPGVLGQALGWLGGAFVSAVVGLIAGGIAAAIITLIALPVWRALRGGA